ncbi:MAG: response regulator transcription factor, partial [Actinomycetes bacterium]
MTIRVLVADDEELVRDGLVTIVSGRPGLEVVATAASGEEAVALVCEYEPDVVLMDVRMPGVDGILATQQIVGSGSASRVLVLTTVETDEVVYAALRAGASGFLLKSARREQLWWGIECVASGDAMLAPSLTRRLIEDRLASGAGLSRPDLTLTARQRDIVR